MNPLYSEIVVLDSLKAFETALTHEIKDRDKKERFTDKKMRDLAVFLRELETGLEKIIEIEDGRNLDEKSVLKRIDAQGVRNAIFMGRQSSKDVFNTIIKKDPEMKKKFNDLYKDSQLKLKFYSEFFQQVVGKHQNSELTTLSARPVGVSDSSLDNLLSLRSSRKNKGPYSYASKVRSNDEIRDLLLGEESASSSSKIKKKFPVSLPSLKKYPRLGRKPKSTITQRTQALCGVVKEVIQWKYGKEERKHPADYAKKVELMDNIELFFHDLVQFEEFISRNPKEGYVTQAREFSDTLGRFFNHNLSPSEKVRCAKFFKALIKELDRFDKAFHATK